MASTASWAARWCIGHQDLYDFSRARVRVRVRVRARWGGAAVLGCSRGGEIGLICLLGRRQIKL